MTPATFRTLGMGDQVIRKSSRKKFSVLATYSHGLTTIVVIRHKQVTARTVSKWIYDGKPLDTMSCLQEGSVIASASTGAKFVVTNATDKHVHAILTLVVNESQSCDWQLHATAWIKVASSFD